jgi:hypothetical protein
MRRTRVFDALDTHVAMEHVLVKGWVRTRRDSKGFSPEGPALKCPLFVLSVDDALRDLEAGLAAWMREQHL